MEQPRLTRPTMERQTLNLWPETGMILGLGRRNSTYAAAVRGEIPTIRIGGRLLVPKAALERLLQFQGLSTEDSGP
jgi:hypothetical protein